MEDVVYNVIATQVAAPEKKHIRSEGALYALLVLGALLVIGLGNRLQAWLGLPPVLVQGVLYALLLRLTGRSEKLIAEVPLESIEYAGPYDGARLKELGCRLGPNVRAGRIEDTTMLIYRAEGAWQCLCLSAQEELKGKLTEPWKN